MPIRYATGLTHQAPPKSAPANIAITGSLAPQGIKEVVIMVMRRSRSFSMVRVAMIPGTEQPLPISMGMKLLPDSPKRRNTRSMMNAMRAI